MSQFLKGFLFACGLFVVLVAAGIAFLRWQFPQPEIVQHASFEGCGETFDVAADYRAFEYLNFDQDSITPDPLAYYIRPLFDDAPPLKFRDLFEDSTLDIDSVFDDEDYEEWVESVVAAPGELAFVGSGLVPTDQADCILLFSGDGTISVEFPDYRTWAVVVLVSDVEGAG